MRVSYNWLLDYIDPGLTPEELAEKMTMSGIEVGAVERFGSPLENVAAGIIMGMEPHPGRNNLTLVDTDTGQGVFRIVCGAGNMEVGDAVVVALPGAVLPGDRRIETANIHGVLSPGMLCSAPELGLELGSPDEILILDPGVVPGEPASGLLGFGDSILHLELTPNRADCLSMYGVACEVAALTGSALKMPALNPPEGESKVGDAVSITVVDTDLCPRYTARILEDITIAPSPLSMQIRLLKAGIRPISNVVDITNYVMWEFGQPLHAFDLELLADRVIVVRRAADGEMLITLDGIERKLDREALVIADSKSAVGLAGVMGGENTEIRKTSRSVLIEAAAFHPTNIRRTARRYNLPSEASQRFEKGVNPDAVLWSQDRAALLINKLAGGRVLKGVIDRCSRTVEPARIQVSPQRISKILGLSFTAERVSELSTRLGFSVLENNDSSLLVEVPPRRADIQIEEDIAEEVARLHGYDQIPLTLPRGELLENREPQEERLKRLAADILIACGYSECITYSFINPLLLSRLRLPASDPLMQPIPVQNPFSEEQAVMRTTLLPGLLRAAQYNNSHRELDQLLFEIGAVFEAESLPLDELPLEKVKVALVATGRVPEPNWIVPSGEADFFTLKGALEALFARLQLEKVQYTPSVLPFMHPARCAQVVVGNAVVGFLGQLHPEVASAWELEQAVTLAELDLDLLVSEANPVPRFNALPRYPAANRDLAIVVPREVPSARIEEKITEAGRGLVTMINLFDLYEGPQIPGDKRSLAYALTFRLEGKTLTDAEINGALRDIEKALQDLGAVLRS